MIRKAVIPAAGFGTRFLPASKSQPKEMLPIVDTPVIQYVVEEAVESGITDIVMVIGKGKRAIEEHFDRNFELENELREKGKEAELKMIQRISNLADIHFVWQKELNGLGDAVYSARHHVGDEPFVVLLGDTVLDSDRPVTRQLLEKFEETGASVVALEEVAHEKVSRYGVIDGDEVSDSFFKVNAFVEKPAPEDAPSNLAIAGRYALTPKVFELLAATEAGLNSEIQLTDALIQLLDTESVYGLRFDGRRFDIGNKLDFIKTNVLLSLAREDLAEDMMEFIRELAKEGE